MYSKWSGMANMGITASGYSNYANQAAQMGIGQLNKDDEHFRKAQLALEEIALLKSSPGLKSLYNEIVKLEAKQQRELEAKKSEYDMFLALIRGA